jgi:hypothetical protein
MIDMTIPLVQRRMEVLLRLLHLLAFLLDVRTIQRWGKRHTQTGAICSCIYIRYMYICLENQGSNPPPYQTEPNQIGRIR